MQGKSWRPGLGCPGRETLALVKVPYRDFGGQARTGSLVVAAAVAKPVAAAFTRIFAGGFLIARMDLVDRYGGDDDASMAANNTSAFNCRFVEGTAHLSAHAFGLAVDINPVQNPYVRGGETAPAAGRRFDTPPKRGEAHARGEPGLIMPGDRVTKAFAAQGWIWGGAWRSEKDYQHFAARLGGPARRAAGREPNPR
jgi:poly-gamma-glutamate synthesis protein (capsule biosynthesis protein)